MYMMSSWAALRPGLTLRVMLGVSALERDKLVRAERTLPAPSTMRERAVMIALACCRCGIACAIFGSGCGLT